MKNITTELYVSSKIREALKKGIYSSIIKRGHSQAGAIIVEIELGIDKSSLYGRRINFDGCFEWYCITKKEVLNREEIIKKLDEEIDRDPDCWIISVQNSNGINIFDSPI